MRPDPRQLRERSILGSSAALLRRSAAPVVPFRQSRLRIRGTVSGPGSLDVGPRWPGGVFMPTVFIVGKGGTCTVDGDFRLMTGSSVIVEPGAQLRLGSGFINNGTKISCFTGVSIGEGTHIGPDVVVMDSDSHAIAPSTGPVAAPITIGDHVWIGARAVVLKGVTIGDGAVVAAASVVTKDVAPGTLVAGSPARYVRDVTWTP
jgi:acetyltransferase-like isoleucine patch superfamily enzyme